MRLGCHAVLFRRRIADETQNVLSLLHEAGAEGAEIGSRFFGIEKAGALMDSLHGSGMMLSGLHASIDLKDLLDNPDRVIGTLESVAGFLLKTDCRSIIMTGNAVDEDAHDLGDSRFLDRESMERLAGTLDAIVSSLKAKTGVQVNYHNHNWEFKNDAILYEVLLSNAPSLHFALDTGWAYVMGYDPARLIARAPERMRYFHLRDVDRSLVTGDGYEDLEKAFVRLGEGEMDYRHLMKAIMDNLDEDDWAVIEYEKGDSDGAVYHDAVRFVRKVMQEVAE